MTVKIGLSPIRRSRRFALRRKSFPAERTYFTASAAEGDGSATGAASAGAAGVAAESGAEAAGVETQPLEHEEVRPPQESQAGVLYADTQQAVARSWHFGRQHLCLWIFTLQVEQQFAARLPACAALPVTRISVNATAINISFFNIMHSTLPENRRTSKETIEVHSLPFARAEANYFRFPVVGHFHERLPKSSRLRKSRSVKLTRYPISSHCSDRTTFDEFRKLPNASWSGRAGKPTIKI